MTFDSESCLEQGVQTSFPISEVLGRLSSSRPELWPCKPANGSLQPHSPGCRDRNNVHSTVTPRCPVEYSCHPGCTNPHQPRTEKPPEYTEGCLEHPRACGQWFSFLLDPKLKVQRIPNQSVSSFSPRNIFKAMFSFQTKK